MLIDTANNANVKIENGKYKMTTIYNNYRWLYKNYFLFYEKFSKQLQYSIGEQTETFMRFQLFRFQTIIIIL